MESGWVCHHTSDNKIARPRSESPTCLTINHKNYNFQDKKTKFKFEIKGKFALKDLQKEAQIA